MIARSLHLVAHPSVFVYPVAVVAAVTLLTIVPDLATALVFGVPAAILTLVVLLVLNSGKLGARIARARWQAGAAVAACATGLAILAELIARRL